MISETIEKKNPRWNFTIFKSKNQNPTTQLVLLLQLYLFSFNAGCFIFRISKSAQDDPQLLLLLQKLWQLDKNRLIYGREIQLLIQGRVPWSETAVGDSATQPLFNPINRLLLEKPTFKGAKYYLFYFISRTSDLKGACVSPNDF